ncbi:MAG: helix-turn-helix domain-containing protein [Lachnospiraceae bacterium]|nr:helix-turn-helix domain-containing protein [Lachnospiraceae bacterium]
MTRKELQEILQISKPTALFLLKEKYIESFRVSGKRYRITKEALQEYLKPLFMPLDNNLK